MLLRKLLDALGLRPGAGTGPEVRLTRAEIADAPIVQELALSFHHEHITSWGEDSSAAWTKDQVKAALKSAAHVVILAFGDDRPIGFAAGLVATIGSVAKVGRIEAIYVLPGLRRTGVARRLMDRLIGELIAIGADDLELIVATRNEPARKFFASFGFAHGDRVMELKYPKAHLEGDA
jgi:ribosomal protein S18 acetylase RimI-like enzyme